jgi:hypothetical protein
VLPTQHAQLEEEGMHKEVLDRVTELVTTAFGLVAALAWNTAIQDFFKTQSLLSAGGPWVYAILVTVIAVGVTVWLGRMVARAKDVKVPGRK